MSEHLRFSLLPILRRHWQTLITRGKRRPSWFVVCVLYLIPLLIGVLFGAWFWPQLETPIMAEDGKLRTVVSAATNPLLPVLAAAGTLIAAFLAMFVLLMNLRIKLLESPEIPQTPTLHRLITHTVTSCAYLMIPASAVIGIGLAATLFWEQLAVSLPIILQAAVGVILALLTHVLLTTVTVLRRLYGSYISVFSSDEGAQLRIIRNHRNDRSA